MKRNHIILAGIAVALVWLFWPRAGIPMFTLEPVIIHAGGDTPDGN